MEFTILTVDLLRNVLDSLPDGILIVSESRRMVYNNDRFRELWNIPMNRHLDDEGQAIMEYALSQVVDPALFVQNIEALHQSDEDYEDEIQLRDGRVFKRRSVSFNDVELGRSRIWIFTDVTAILHSQMDSLTGLLNRNKFERHFTSFSVEATPQTMVGIALFDIDQFKKYNDTYGHLAGDDVLRKIGEVIRNHLQRSTDKGYRVGGEEFSIQYCGRNKEEIVRVMEAIRASVEQLAIPHKTNPPFNCVTISCGFGICTKPNLPEVIYRQVDNALYESKAKGRNQITIVELDLR